MSEKNLARLLAASAVIALIGASAAHAQIAPRPDRFAVYSFYGAPQIEPGDEPVNWSAQQNVVESERYDRLTRTNPAFRAVRIRQECGSINEPDLYQQCVATFY